MKPYLEKGIKHLPECMQNKPRTKQKNNYNVRKRGSNIIYYSTLSDDCFSNCMSRFSKCMESVSGDQVLNKDHFTDPTLYEQFQNEQRRKNIFSGCMSTLSRCLGDCPQESRPPPAGGRRPGGPIIDEDISGRGVGIGIGR